MIIGGIGQPPVAILMPSSGGLAQYQQPPVMTMGQPVAGTPVGDAASPYYPSTGYGQQPTQTGNGQQQPPPPSLYPSGPAQPPPPACRT